MPNENKEDKENTTGEVIGEVVEAGIDLLDGLGTVGDVLSGIGDVVGSLLS